MSEIFDVFDEQPPLDEKGSWDYDYTALGLAETLADYDKQIRAVQTYIITQEQIDVLVADLIAEAKAMTEQYMKRHDNNGKPKADETTN